MTDWRDKLRELGFGNQAVIVGTKRRELFDEIEKMFVERQKVLELLVDEESVDAKASINVFDDKTVIEIVELHRVVANQLRATLRKQIKEMK
jgi:hypothetical protein